MIFDEDIGPQVTGYRREFSVQAGTQEIQQAPQQQGGASNLQAPTPPKDTSGSCATRDYDARTYQLSETEVRVNAKLEELQLAIERLATMQMQGQGTMVESSVQRTGATGVLHINSNEPRHLPTVTSDVPQVKRTSYITPSQDRPVRLPSVSQ